MTGIQARMFGIAIVVLTVVVGLLVGIALTPASQDSSTQEVSVVDESVEMTEEEGGNSGFGISYTGKMGIDLGGGLIMPMNGGTPQLGYGF